MAAPEREDKHLSAWRHSLSGTHSRQPPCVTGSRRALVPRSQVRTKQPSDSLAQALLWQAAGGPEQRQREAGAAQPCRGWKPPSSPSGAQLGQGAAPGTAVPATAPARQGLQPCPSARRGQSSPWGRCCCRLRAPQRCSCPLPLALSPAACVLCRRAEADPDICGDKLEKCGLCAHVFCMFFATLLFRQENEHLGLMGFLPRDIQIAVARAAQKHCCVCGQSGATIMCCKEDCGRWFHLPCAKEGGCVNQYISPYSSFCPEHRPEQDVEVTPEPGTDCLICMEPVEDRKTFTTLVCPTCRRAWFHRDCIQGHAMHAGLLCLQCPLCREGQEFIVEMLVLGIRVPFSRQG
ncbi:PHD finger protein 7-like [Motacilla alba alba]|uniref:PHD finger protein 7-like n=1 Tax=Motacilla alba alba TaxID=1094192 RepID=UPI0018D4E877|nr:PHD finger protein 7-like [Motacilla alba alba]